MKDINKLLRITRCLNIVAYILIFTYLYTEIVCEISFYWDDLGGRKLGV